MKGKSRLAFDIVCLQKPRFFLISILWRGASVRQHPLGERLSCGYGRSIPLIAGP